MVQRIYGVAAALMLGATSPVYAYDTESERAQALLDDMLGTYSLLMQFQVDSNAAALVAVAGDHVSAAYFGESAPGVPTAGDTVFRVGSLSKVFTGQVLAQMAVDGTVALDDPVKTYLPEFTNTAFNGRELTLVDVVNQSSGLLRELPQLPYAEGSYDSRQTRPVLQQYFESAPLIYEPGARTAYSNLGFQLLGAALASAEGSSYAETLAKHVTGPLGMTDTGLAPPEGAEDRLAPGHFFDGSEMEIDLPGDLVGASGGLFTTADDMTRFLQWHLSADLAPAAELSQKVRKTRDEFISVSGLDESGPMDGIALSWIAMDATPYRAAMLQKSGAHGGYMAFMVIAPEKRVGVFAVMNMFDFTRYEHMVNIATGLASDIPAAMD